MSPVEDRRFSDTRRKDWLEDVRRDTERAGRWDYYIPAIILAAGFAVAVSIIMSQVNAGLLPSLVGATVYAGLFLIITLPIGVVAMIVTCSLLSADAGPIPIALLRIAALYAVALVILLVLPGCFNLLVSGLIMAGMVAMLFDTELLEGAVFTIVSWVILVGVNIALASIL